MDRLCDELLQLVFYELADPSPLVYASQRFYKFSQDPYVRAHYFLAHYGPVEAMYYALGRGKLMTERVIDILLSSGACMSRYLIQIAMHHYFHTQTHFIKTIWVRNVPLRVFAYFLKVAEEKYGEIPRGKGEDDGAVFMTFLKESRMSQQSKTITWEGIKLMMDKYHFIPFCNRDPIMVQFPLVLAIEPKLLPYAISNGFSMDYKYRDFVFRKMFERSSPSLEIQPEDIAHNVRELCKLDNAMFVSRTVAAEVCMEARQNDVGYEALKQLDKSGDLRFELPSLVEDLLTTFLGTRSICSAGEVLMHLYRDFPSTNASVRLVILVIVFLAADSQRMTPVAIKSKLDGLGLTHITRKDLFNVLINPFMERHISVLNYAGHGISTVEGTRKGMSQQEISKFVEEVAERCLEIPSKGKLLKSLVDGYPHVKSFVSRLVVEKYRVNINDIPRYEDRAEESTCIAKLSRDILAYGIDEVHTADSLVPELQVKSESRGEALNELDSSMDVDASTASAMTASPQNPADHKSLLGNITQESLTSMIRNDEITPIRGRRRINYTYNPIETSGKYRYPHDYLHVGKWAKSAFGPMSPVTAVFMTHAILNNNCNMLHHYLMAGENGQPSRVPVTLKHFQLLALLGRQPNFYLWHDVENGAPFFFDEKDYASHSSASEQTSDHRRFKTEISRNPSLQEPSAGQSSSSSSSSTSTIRSKKRPRRSAAGTIHSYAVPDSDDEAIVDDLEPEYLVKDSKKVQPKETDLQLWIKHLTLLLKTESRQHAATRRRLEKEAETKVRIPRNDFVKSLATNLRSLKKLEADRTQYADAELDESSDADDEEYMSSRAKRRKI